MQNKIYLIKDRSDTNIRRPFVAIFKKPQNAYNHVEQMQKNMDTKVKNLISVEPLEVSDFDANKTHVYSIFNRADSNSKSPLVGMFFDFHNAEIEVSKLKKKVPFHAQKLVSTSMIKFNDA